MAWYKIFPSVEVAQEKIPERKMQKVKIKGRMIFITRLEDRFFACDDECPHQGASLSEGALNHLQEVICPWHGYRFSLNSGEEQTGKSCGAIRTYNIKVDNDGFYINLEI